MTYNLGFPKLSRLAHFQKSWLKRTFLNSVWKWFWFWESQNPMLFMAPALATVERDDPGVWYFKGWWFLFGQWAQMRHSATYHGFFRTLPQHPVFLLLNTETRLGDVCLEVRLIPHLAIAYHGCHFTAAVSGLFAIVECINLRGNDKVCKLMTVVKESANLLVRRSVIYTLLETPPQNPMTSLIH